MMQYNQRGRGQFPLRRGSRLQLPAEKSDHRWPKTRKRPLRHLPHRFPAILERSENCLDTRRIPDLAQSPDCLPAHDRFLVPRRLTQNCDRRRLAEAAQSLRGAAANPIGRVLQRETA
jgi:hypothetical protein